MTSAGRMLRRCSAPTACVSALAALFVLTACNFGENTAGGSSEVDNPVMVALVDASGSRTSVTGSISLFLADQSPALNPAPRLEIRLENVDSIILNSKTLATAGLTDSTRSFNLYVRGDDSTGSFLQNLVYNPTTKRFSRADGAALAALELTIAPLARIQSFIQGGADSSGISRVIIPGSPFQAVLVDSTFVFEVLPPGVFPLHLLTPGGAELPLPEPLDTRAPRHHRVNLDTTPVVRPPQPAPPTISVHAGIDRSVFEGTEVSLAAQISGVNPGDERLAVLWSQIPPSNPGVGFAVIERPTKLETKVSFPRTGAYTFTVTAVLGNQQVVDTVVIGVQSAPQNIVIIEPGPGDTVYMFHGYNIVWEATKRDTLTVEFSGDSGTTWIPLPGPPTHSKIGFNNRYWQPVSPFVEPSANCFFRLVNKLGETVATSPRFVLMYN